MACSGVRANYSACYHQSYRGCVMTLFIGSLQNNVLGKFLRTRAPLTRSRMLNIAHKSNIKSTCCATAEQAMKQMIQYRKAELITHQLTLFDKYNKHTHDTTSVTAHPSDKRTTMQIRQFLDIPKQTIWICNGQYSIHPKN